MADWLSGWAKRVKLTADSSVIDSDLTDFPSLLYLSSASGKNAKDLTFIFDEVGANSKKIAVTKSDGTTQCYVEIETWDAVNEKAWLWVKAPSLSSTTDTDYYLYFDNSQADNTTYVGDPESTPAQNVWDSNFKMRQSMKDYDTSHIHDSTSNNNDGTKYAANEPIETDGKIAKAQDFDGTDDRIDVGDTSTFKFLHGALDTSGFKTTVSMWVKMPTIGDDLFVLVGDDATSSGNVGIWVAIDNRSSIPYVRRIRYTITYGSSGNYVVNYTSADEAFPNDGAWHHLVFVYDQALASQNLKIYLDGALDLTGNKTGNTPSTADSTYALDIGAEGTGNYTFDGIMDELRISDTNRSAAWIKTAYNSGNDSLWTWGGMEVSKGLTEYLGLADTVTKSPSLVKTESLGLVDTYSRVWDAYRTYDELLGLVDSITASKLLVKVLTETLGLLDTYSRVWGAHRTYSELLGLADSIQKEPSKTFPEALGLLDTALKSTSITRTELLGLSDSALKSTSITRTELLGLVDSITASRLLVKVLTEALGLLDTFGRTWTIYRTYTEELGLKDYVSKGAAKTFTEILGLLDTVWTYQNLTALDKLIKKLIQITEIGW